MDSRVLPSQPAGPENDVTPEQAGEVTPEQAIIAAPPDQASIESYTAAFNEAFCTAKKQAEQLLLTGSVDDMFALWKPNDGLFGRTDFWENVRDYVKARDTADIEQIIATECKGMGEDKRMAMRGRLLGLVEQGKINASNCAEKVRLAKESPEKFERWRTASHAVDDLYLDNGALKSASAVACGDVDFAMEMIENENELAKPGKQELMLTPLCGDPRKGGNQAEKAAIRTGDTNAFGPKFRKVKGSLHATRKELKIQIAQADYEEIIFDAECKKRTAERAELAKMKKAKSENVGEKRKRDDDDSDDDEPVWKMLKDPEAKRREEEEAQRRLAAKHN